jgi:hypothetical protein
VVELRILRTSKRRVSSRIRMNFPAGKRAPDYGSRPEDLRLLQDPKWGTLFDRGLHCDRGGTVAPPCVWSVTTPVLADYGPMDLV